jgi:hypothetical protein
VMRGWFGRRPAGAAPPSRFLVAYTMFSLAYFAAFALWILSRFVPLVASQMRGAWRALGAAGGPLAALEPALFLVAALGLLVGIALIGWQWLRARAAPGAGRARDAAGPAEPPGG